MKGDAGVGVGGEGGVVGLGQVMGIDDDLACSSCDDVIKGRADERSMIKWDEGFGKLSGQRAEALPEAGTQNKSLVHGVVLRSSCVGCK